MATVEDKLKGFGQLVSKQRSKDGLSLRKAANEVDVSFNVIARLERGHLPTVESFVKLLLWHPKTRDEIAKILTVLEGEKK